MRKSVQVLIFALAIFVYAGSLVWITHHVEAAQPIDCRKVQPHPLVRDYDGRLWQVDVCAVAQDDAGASQYKEEVK